MSEERETPDPDELSMLRRSRERLLMLPAHVMQMLLNGCTLDELVDYTYRFVQES